MAQTLKKVRDYLKKKRACVITHEEMARITKLSEDELQQLISKYSGGGLLPLMNAQPQSRTTLNVMTTIYESYSFPPDNGIGQAYSVRSRVKALAEELLDSVVKLGVRCGIKGHTGLCEYTGYELTLLLGGRLNMALALEYLVSNGKIRELSGSDDRVVILTSLSPDEAETLSADYVKLLNAKALEQNLDAKLKHLDSLLLSMGSKRRTDQERAKEHADDIKDFIEQYNEAKKDWEEAKRVLADVRAQMWGDGNKADDDDEGDDDDAGDDDDDDNDN